MGVGCLRSEEWSSKLQRVLLPAGVAWGGVAWHGMAWHGSRAGLLQLLADTQRRMPYSPCLLPCSTLLLLAMRSGHKVSSKFTPLAKEHLLCCQRSFVCNFTELSQLALHQMSAVSGQAVVVCSQKQLGKEGDDRKEQGTFIFDEMLTWLVVYSV